MKKIIYFTLLFCGFFLIKSSYALAFSDGTDYPVGKPDAIGYYDAQEFNMWNDDFQAFHLGEDWNGQNCGDCDLGSPIYSIASGVVTEVNHLRGWGNIVIILYELPNGIKYKALYGHLNEVTTQSGSTVIRGQQIGTIGKGDNNKFWAHLHFELRDNINLGAGQGYGATHQAGYVNPHIYINSHRPVNGQVLTAVSGGVNKIDLSWTKAEDPRFEKYEIYRSLEPTGTSDPLKRTLVYSSSDPNILITSDSQNLSPGATYYYRIFTYFNSGQIAESNEVSIGITREYINITNHPEPQQYPTIDGNLITWQDNRVVSGLDYQKLYLYDISTGEIEKIGINIEGLRSGAHTPFIKGKYVIYTAQDSSFYSTGANVYAVNLETGEPFLITKAKKDQMSPVVSDDGIAVWSDLRNGSNLDLYYIDLNKAEGEKVFVNASGNQRSPRIWGNKVVWKDSRVGNRHDLYLKEIGSSEETLLATNAGDGAPDIWENWVVWEYKGKVSLIDLNTKVVKVLAEKSAGGIVRVRDNKVVYSVIENSKYYIHVYDITTGKDIKLDIPITNLPFVAISGNTVVFDKLEPTGSSNLDIYYTVL